MFYFMLCIVILTVVFFIINYVIVVRQLRKADEEKTIDINDVKNNKEQ